MNGPTMPLFRWRKRELRDRFYPPEFRGMYDRFSDVIHHYVRLGDLMLVVEVAASSSTTLTRRRARGSSSASTLRTSPAATET
jgi:hypothetical protein